MQEVKQVIVMRTDLNMRKGKMIAQGAHASNVFLVNAVILGTSLSQAEVNWLERSFTKICVQIDSEAGLLNIIEDARQAGIKVFPITDSGRTEFNGVPTLTCAALGPDYSNLLDCITGHLKLL